MVLSYDVMKLAVLAVLSYTVHTGSVTVDANLDDAAWRDASVLTAFRRSAWFRVPVFRTSTGRWHAYAARNARR